MKPIDKLLSTLDTRDFYESVFGKIKDRSNFECPFPERHEKGEDTLPSFRVFLDTGGTYCHGCGYKSTNPVYFWADYKKIPYEKALRRLYHKHVEPLVPNIDYKSPHEKLMNNDYVLRKLLVKRGLEKQTVKKFLLGYDGRRLTIPIFNEFSMCVNIRRYDLFKDSGPKVVSYAEGYGKARLYPLQSLQHSTIFVTEGELDALLGIQNGLDCITPSGGNNTWDHEWSKLFKGKVVYVIPDNDKPGISGAQNRVASISKYAKKCVMLKLPVEGEKEDLTDWIMKYGGTRSKLIRLAESVTGEEIKAKAAPSDSGLDILDVVDGVKKSPAEEAAIKRSEAVWADLTDGGAFFRDQQGQLFYVKEGMAAMKVTKDHGQFSSFLASRSPLINQATSTGRFILNHILNKAHSQSELSRTAVWSMYEGGKLYVHGGGDKLLRISEDKCDVIKNAINDERILLELPVPSMSLKLPRARDVSEGLGHLRNLFLDNLPMQEEDKYLLICWMSAIFFRGYIKPKPLMRFMAKTASGKSTSSKLVSLLMYGEELLSHSASTVAATYEMSNRYPLLMLDNLETRNMNPQLEDFLLVAATGGMKAKRQMSTDVGLVIQHTDSLVLSNGIEPFNRHELIDRTMEIELDLDKYARKGFQEAKMISGLKAERQKILSAILFLIQRYVIPRVKKGEVSRIMKEFGQHGKTRFNEYLALMSIVLDAFWGYMPMKAYARPHDLVNFWLDSQTAAEQKQDEGTNEVLYFLSTFASRYDQMLGVATRVEKHGEKLVFKVTTRELLSDFRVMAKQLGIKCPWQNERQLGSRIADSEEMLNRAGWHRIRGATMGRTYYKFKYIPKGE
jgi:hypothetical protein